MCQSVNCEDNAALMNHQELSLNQNKKTVNTDLLATITIYHKKAVDSVHAVFDKAYENNKIRVLMECSQVVHAMAAIAIIFVGSIFYQSQTQAPKPYGFYLSLIYILAFSLHLGAQFWMTFVSGLSLYFSLPRHAFGDVQKVLFPRYFTINSILSAIVLLSFSKLHSHLTWETRHWVQVIALSCCFLLELLSRLYITPQVISLIDKKRKIEERVPGVGQEIGSHSPGELANCTHYMAIQSSFRKKHSVMATANILSMACTIVHLVCLNQALANSL